jgi:tetratricopeptide (TPR) repeat protein
MLRQLRVLLAAAVSFAAPPERRFELRGVLEPAPGRAAHVTLDGVGMPLLRATQSDARGRFRFRRIPAGSYVVRAAAAGEGEVRRTIEVGPAQADARGVVAVTIPFRPSPESALRMARRRNAVSKRDLAVPEAAWNHYRAAQEALGRGDRDGAMARLERAVKAAACFSAAWNFMGTLLYQAGDFPRAEGNFRRALECSPGSFEATVNLGGVLLNLNRLEEALPYNREAVNSRPDDPLAQSQLGTNYFFLGSLDRALEHLERARRIDPGHYSRPQLILARIHMRRGEGEAAAREFQEFLSLHPDAPEAPRIRERLKRLRWPRGADPAP